MNLAQLPIDESRESPARFAGESAAVLDALDCLRVAVTLYDRHERLIYLNRHFNHLFRAMPPPVSLIGLSYQDLIRLELECGEIAPAPTPQAERAFIESRLAQFRSGDYAPRDIALADGRIIEIKARQTAEGGWIALWSDATAARRAFGRLETAVELSADAFAFWDRDDRLALCNPAFAALHGRAPHDDLKGLSFTTLVTELVDKALVHIDVEAEAWIAQRVATHNRDAGALTVTMANGDAYLVRERATADGGRATVYTDVTDRHRAEAAVAEASAALVATQRALSTQTSYLADLTKRLDKAEQGATQAKTTFLRTMSHELKTPLNAIIGFSDLLKSAPGHFSSEQVGEYAGLIHTAGGNLLRMLNQILDLTKIAAGRFALNRGPVTVSGILLGALDATSEAAERKSVAVTIGDCAPDLAVHADETALTAMVVHLAENAVAFTQNGGSVCLSARRSGARVEIAVTDNGPGVPADALERIVEPFEQLGGGIGGHSQGSGLGLPLVKALAELHGGALILASEHGEGFTATLDLPAA